MRTSVILARCGALSAARAGALILILAASAIPALPQQKTDGLTTASLEDLMNMEVVSVSKTQQKLSYTYGHLAGDTVPKETARRIDNSIRSYDVVGRYGREEFLIVAPSCDAPSAMRLAERIRDAIGSVPVPADGAAVHVTASCGSVSAAKTPAPIRRRCFKWLTRPSIARSEMDAITGSSRRWPIFRARVPHRRP